MNTTTNPDTRPAPVEVVSPIKPSEAIRLGCLTFPVQHFGNLAWRNRACAIGAMYAGYGDNPRSVYTESADADAAHDRIEKIHRCPEGDYLERDRTVVAHLNDDHRWSRERIADWLESLGL